MTQEPSLLPHLLSLLCDEDSNVRKTVLAQLSNYGRNLEKFLYQNAENLSPEQLEYLEPLLIKNRRAEFLYRLRQINTFTNKTGKLELFYQYLSDCLNGPEYLIKVGATLDTLVHEFSVGYNFASPESLAHFLFRDKKIGGCEKDYYRVENSEIISAILDKTGLPITLSALYILCAQRLGLDVYGCNLPGHFIAGFVKNGRYLFVDCYNKGNILEEKDFFHYFPDAQIKMSEILRTPATIDSIINRILRNLAAASEKKNDNDAAKFYHKVLKFFNRNLPLKRSNTDID